jgi:hypothetical protein
VSPFSPSFWFNYEFFACERVDGHESAYAPFLLPGAAVLFVTLVFFLALWLATGDPGCR